LALSVHDGIILQTPREH